MANAGDITTATERIGDARAQEAFTTVKKCVMLFRAAEGSYKAFDRVRTLSTIMPVVIIGVDLIPGLCPAWYAVLQGLSAPALIGVAFITRGSALSAAFPKKTVSF
ncbi:hypothetical protein [Nonomuraea sp. NPDC005501]|uniref:hypothetical protein n=1 Tax=Nonomuraea sp. NPDC005501 TaxID=3156884 RepID=UPI0033BE88E2